MKIQIIQHAQFGKSGVIQKWADEKNHEVTITRSFDGEVFKEDFDVLITLGGPQNIMEKERYPYLLEEIAFIGKSSHREKKILGIGLGAHLIAHAYGANSEKISQAEMGVFSVNLNELGQSDPLFHAIPSDFEAFHWHECMMGVPENAQILADSHVCPRQIVKFANNIYGLECHIEMTRENVLELMEGCGDKYSDAKGDFVQFPEEIFASDFGTMNTRMHFFLDSFLNLPTPEAIEKSLI